MLRRNNKRSLYESIMKDVAKTVKKHLNENDGGNIDERYIVNNIIPSKENLRILKKFSNKLDKIYQELNTLTIPGELYTDDCGIAGAFALYDKHNADYIYFYDNAYEECSTYVSMLYDKSNDTFKYYKLNIENVAKLVTYNNENNDKYQLEFVFSGFDKCFSNFQSFIDKSLYKKNTLVYDQYIYIRSNNINDLINNVLNIYQKYLTFCENYMDKLWDKQDRI